MGRRHLLGVWFSLLLTVAAFGQGGSGLDTFKLMDQFQDGTFVTLPKRLRFRCIYYQPVSIVELALEPNECGIGVFGKRAKVVTNGVPLTGDDAMAAMPVYRGEVAVSAAGEVHLNALAVQRTTSVATGNMSPWSNEVMGAALVLQYRNDFGIYLRGSRFTTAAGPSTNDAQEFFCYQSAIGISNLMGHWKDLPGGRNEFNIGKRWEYGSTGLGAHTEVSVYLDTRTLRTCDPNNATSHHTYIGAGGTEYLWAVYQLEEDPGSENGTIPPECCDEIVAAIDATTNAVQALNTSVVGLRTDLSLWHEEWQVSDARIAADFDTVIEKLTTMAEPTIGDLVSGEVTDPGVPMGVPNGLWETHVGTPLSGVGITGLSETHVPPSGAPVWSWSIPLGTWSVGMGGPYFNPIEVSADFSPLTPYRLIIHAFFYAAVGVWAVIFLYEELRRY